MSKIMRASLVLLALVGLRLAADPVIDAELARIQGVVEEEKNAYVALDESRLSAVWEHSGNSTKLYLRAPNEHRLEGYSSIARDSAESLQWERSQKPEHRSQFQFSKLQTVMKGDSAWVTCNVKYTGTINGSAKWANQARIYVLHRNEGQWKLSLMSITELSAGDGSGK